MKILGYLAVILIIGVVSYGGWILQKKISYTFSYEEMVEETVCKMVKSEYLKKPCQP